MGERMTQYELNLRDYYRIFRKQRVTVFLIFCLTMGISHYFLSSQEPSYHSSIKVKLGLRTPVIGDGHNYSYTLGEPIETQKEIIRSRSVLERAAENLGWLEGVNTVPERDLVFQRIYKIISTEQIGSTSVIRVTATSTEQEEVRGIAQAVAEAYVAYNLDEVAKDKRTMRLFIEEELEKATQNLALSEETLKRFQENVLHGDEATQLRSEISTLDLKLQDLLLRATPKHPEVLRIEQQLKTAREKLKKLPGQELSLSRLTKEVNDNQAIVTQLKQKYHEARIQESEKAGNVTIVEDATPPKISFKNDPKTGRFFAAIMGLLLGFIAAFVREALDTSIGAIEDVESFLETGVLGMIPHMAGPDEKKHFGFFSRFKLMNDSEKVIASRSRLVTQFDPRSPEAESYHTLRAAVYSVLQDKEKIAIAMSSTGPREGKTLTSCNLAIASAQMGKKTLLVDTDFRRPTIHDIFGLDRTPGLFETLTRTISYDQALRNVSDLLMGDAKWQEALKSPHLGYLNFMTAGHLPPNPPELLASQEMGNLIRTLMTEFDFIIFDCPPVLPVADTLILGPKVNGVILVYQSGRTARNALKRAKIQLDTAKAKLLGVVFNDIRSVEAEPGSSYYYRYQKYYSDPEREKLKKQTEDRA